MTQSTITITFGEGAENHVGMQMIGSRAAEGFTCEELQAASMKFTEIGYQCEYLPLHTLIKMRAEEAAVLIVRNGVNALLDGNVINPPFLKSPTADDLLQEQLALQWDKKALMYGRVVNKHRSYNLCFDDQAQDPDYEQGKGTIIHFNQVPLISHIRNRLSDYFGSKAHQLKAEGNYYYDLKTCYIGWHGDAERKRVIAIRLGDTMPLYYQWYYQNQPIGEMITLTLNHGDVYIMSEKATGWDWKGAPYTPTLRHAAGLTETLVKSTKSTKRKRENGRVQEEQRQQQQLVATFLRKK